MVERKVTFCRICEASCGLIAECSGEQVLRLLPDPQHVMSRGFACVKGTRYVEMHNSKDRVLTPLKRVGQGYEPVSWEQALREIGEKVQSIRAAHGADSVGVYVGNPAAFSMPHVLFAGMFAGALGTRHLYTSGSQDCNNKFVVAEEMFGAPMLQPIPDFDRARFIMLIGSNPAVSQLSFSNYPRAIERLKEVSRAGGRIVFVNPRRTESAQQVGEQVFIRPGSDVFFLLALAHVVLSRVRPGPELLDHATGYEQLCSVVQPWTPERVEKVCGVPASAVRELALAYLEADGAALYAGTGVNQGPHGTLCVWLMHALSLLTGNLDREGGMLLTRQLVLAAKLGPSGERIQHRTPRVSAHRSVLDSLPAGILPDEILTPGEGQLCALFVTAGNPLLSCPNSERMRDALSRLDLLVSIDLFRNETGNLAHYVLPATSFLERSDIPLGMSGWQSVPYAQYVDAVVPARGESRDEWWIFARLAQACRTPLGSRPFQAWLDLSTGQASWLPRLLRFGPRVLFALLALLLHRLTLGALRRAPHGVLTRPHRTGTFVARSVLTKTRKIDLAPERFISAAAALDAAHDELCRAADGLRLITKRERTSHNSWLHNVEAFVSGSRSTNYLYMHPADAASRELHDGELCEVRSATGALKVPLRLSEELMPGAVALPHGWGHQSADGLTVASRTRGQNANLLAPDGPDALEPLSGMARLTALDVQVLKLPQ